MRSHSSGADLALPLSGHKCHDEVCFWISSLVTCFVNRSPEFWAPGCLNISKSSAWSRCWIHSWPTTRCLTFPSPSRRQMPMADDESAFRLRSHLVPRSVNTRCTPKPSHAPFRIPKSSASPLDKARVFWVVDQCLTRCHPNMAQPPDVDFRVATLPAK